MLAHLVSSALTPPLWWAVPNVLAGTSMPLAEDLLLLHRAGIRGIVCLLELPHLAEVYSSAGFAVHMLPLSDGSAPTPEQFRAFLQFMEHQRRVDHPVIVHCLAGRGRTGTVVAAYLIAHGYTVDGALAHIRSLQPLAVETPQQLKFLHDVSSVFTAHT
jgi:atypical dual specificity phosphatase